MKTAHKNAKGGVLKEIKNTFESFSDDFWSNSKDAVKNSFSDFGSQLFGGKGWEPGDNQSPPERFDPFKRKEEKKEPTRVRRTEVVFNYMERQEKNRIHNEIKELIKQVKKEVEQIKLEDKALVNDITKLTMSEVPKDAGIYHLRFLEFIIKLLQSIRKKVSEGRMWLSATFEKKKQKKFWRMAKSKGTKFSMSKELTQSSIPG